MKVLVKEQKLKTFNCVEKGLVAKLVILVKKVAQSLSQVLFIKLKNAIKVGYENYEIVETCIRAFEPGSQLCSYLDGKPDLTFPVLHKILRSHFGKPSATELYKQLTSAVQEPPETPQ